MLWLNYTSVKHFKTMVSLAHQVIGLFLVLINLKVVRLSALKVPQVHNSSEGKAGDFLRQDSCCQNPVAIQATGAGVLLHKCCSSWAVRETQIRPHCEWVLSHSSAKASWSLAALARVTQMFFPRGVWVWGTLLKHKQKKSHLPTPSPIPICSSHRRTV